jgi:hypothetical protein
VDCASSATCGLARRCSRGTPQSANEAADWTLSLATVNLSFIGHQTSRQAVVQQDRGTGGRFGTVTERGQQHECGGHPARHAFRFPQDLIARIQSALQQLVDDYRSSRSGTRPLFGGIPIFPPATRAFAGSERVSCGSNAPLGVGQPMAVTSRTTARSRKNGRSIVVCCS